MSNAMPGKLTVEAVGTLFLLAAVVGSGIMAERLADGSEALALLCNTLATGAMLVVLILQFAPISGAHFNPAVTFAFALKGELSVAASAAYVVAQVVGAVLGVWLAHLMFAEDVLQVGRKDRSGLPLSVAEVVATFGLVATILGTVRWGTKTVAAAVGLYISAAYWFTSSTSFANPAVTIARAVSNTFAGIRPVDVLGFVVAQFAGAALAVVFTVLIRNAEEVALRD